MKKKTKTYLKQVNSRQKYGPCCTPHDEHSESSKYGSIWKIFLLNFDERTSMNAAVTALKYECELLNVTRAEPSGYLCLSVSMPKNIKFFLYQLTTVN